MPAFPAVLDGAVLVLSALPFLWSRPPVPAVLSSSLYSSATFSNDTPPSKAAWARSIFALAADTDLLVQVMASVGYNCNFMPLYGEILSDLPRPWRPWLFG